MSSVLSIDFETRSTVDLKRTGVYPYAVHPTTGIWCMGYAFDDEEPVLWIEGEPLPQRIIDHIRAGGELRAWNCQFERVMWNDCGVGCYGFPRTVVEQWYDTAAEAAAMALPRKLADAAKVLGVAEQKDLKGHRLMLQMCRPRKILPDGTIVWWNDPAKVQRLGQYCLQDVRTERAIAGKVKRLSTFEREVFILDQRINDRGIQLDVELAYATKAAAEEELDVQNRAVHEATAGAVDKVTRVGQLKSWLEERGVEAPSLAKAAVRELLDNGDLPDDVAAALSARAEAAKSSVAKVDAMLRCVSPDGRMRGLLMYHGAATGRWAGRLVQPHNMPRPTIQDAEIEEIIRALLDGQPQSLESISNVLRGHLVAKPGHRFIAVDYNAIEARVLAWVAGQWDLVEMFRVGAPVYKEMAHRIEGVPVAEIEKGTPLYQMGKGVILGCGYGMGWRKFQRQLHEVYGVEISEEKARDIVALYRNTFPGIPEYWRAVNDAAIAAVREPGTTQGLGGGRFIKRGSYLWCRLPSGRYLCYAAPRIVDRETPWGSTVPAVEVSGMNSYTRRWERIQLYGGLLVENIVQAISRDLLADAMVRLENEYHYEIVLTVHDEIVLEVPDGTATVDKIESIMSHTPMWALDCPVTSEGWEGRRYRK